MGNIDFNTDQLPLVVIKGTGKLGMDECKKQCDGFEALMNKDARYVAIIDYSEGKLGITLEISAYLAKWAIKYREAMARCSPVSAIVLSSRLVAAIVNPLLKVMNLPNPVKIFTSQNEALIWLRDTAKSRGLEIPATTKISV